MNLKGVEIRKATKADIAALAKFYQSVIRESYTGSVPETVIEQFTPELLTGEWTKYFEVKKGVAFLLFIDGVLSGFCNSTQSDFSDVDVRLESIYVKKTLIGQRYGSQLFAELVGELIKQGCKSLHLWVLDKNIQARDYYKKLGGIESELPVERHFFGETLHSYVVKWFDLNDLAKGLSYRSPL